MTGALADPAARGGSSAARAAAELRRRIITNQLPPGSDILESEIGTMLGVSRTPAREAAVILEAQGLVEIRPRRGIRVLPLTADDMNEIYQILTELEPLAAFIVASLPRERRGLAGLDATLNDMEEAISRDDRAAWAEADDRLHRRLVELSGNRRLAQVVATYSDQVHRARLVTLHLRPSPVASNVDHRNLVAAIERGDAEEARAIHREHRRQARELLVGLLERHGFTRV